MSRGISYGIPTYTHRIIVHYLSSHPPFRSRIKASIEGTEVLQYQILLTDKVKSINCASVRNRAGLEVFSTIPRGTKINYLASKCSLRTYHESHLGESLPLPHVSHVLFIHTNHSYFLYSSQLNILIGSPRKKYICTIEKTFFSDQSIQQSFDLILKFYPLNHMGKHDREMIREHATVHRMTLKLPKLHHKLRNSILRTLNTCPNIA